MSLCKYVVSMTKVSRGLFVNLELKRTLCHCLSKNLVGEIQVDETVPQSDPKKGEQMEVHALLDAKLEPSRIRAALKGLPSSTVAKSSGFDAFNSGVVTLVTSLTRLDASRALDSEFAHHQEQDMADALLRAELIENIPELQDDEALLVECRNLLPRRSTS